MYIVKDRAYHYVSEVDIEPAIEPNRDQINNSHNLYNITSTYHVCRRLVSDNAVPLPRVTVDHLLGDWDVSDVGDGFGFGLLASFGGEVGFVEELCEEDEVGEVHGHGELDVDLADVAAGRG